MRFFLRLAILWAIITSIAVCQAQVPSSHLSKRAQKIHAALTVYPSGSFLHIILRDGSERFGELGDLGATTFELRDIEFHAASWLEYNAVKSVGNVNTIKRTAWSPHWQHSGLIPVVIVGVAAGVGVAILATSRN